MGSIIGEERHMESGGSSSFKCKRQKVSAIRDFPRGCGPKAPASVSKQIKAMGVRRVYEPTTDVVLTDNCGEKDQDIWEAETKGRQEQLVQPACLNGVELKGSNFATCSLVKCENKELKELPAVGNNKFGKGTNVEQQLLSYYPIPPNFVWKKRKYPSPRRVSAVCDFPPGCGRHLTNLDQNNQVVQDKDMKIKTRSGGASSSNIEPQEKSNGVIEIERGVIVAGLMCATSCPWRQVKRSAKLSSSSKIKKNGYGAQDDRKRSLTKCEDKTEKLAEKSTILKEIGKDKESQQLAFRDNDEDYSEVKKYEFVDDISKGKEKSPIYAVNTIDDEEPPLFTYITTTIYPDWCRPLPLKGCNCKNGCSDPNHCSCAIKNGGEIPYNLTGAILEAKNLVYECGPSCNCPPSCYNRVAQNGIKLPLEIFKTKYMGWGVRCRSFIPSGSLICEYIGELLDDREAEQRIGSDEYLFDISKNYREVMPEIVSDVVENGFTIDAAKYGNVGRFVNHSCSPNLYVQNVLYDHEDERIPHVMLFAMEDIPHLQELTYDYNYTIDQVFDSKGNIKRKNCYCGSVECTGRMY